MISEKRGENRINDQIEELRSNAFDSHPMHRKWKGSEGNKVSYILYI